MGTIEHKLTCSNCKYPALDANQLACSECGKYLHADAEWESKQRWKQVYSKHWLSVYVLLLFPLYVLGCMLYWWELPLGVLAVVIGTCGLFALLGLHERGAWIAVPVFGLCALSIIVGGMALVGNWLLVALGVWVLVLLGASVVSLVVGYSVRKIAMGVFE